MDKKINKILWHGNELDDEGKALAPGLAKDGGDGLDGLNEGEIYINNADDDPSIFIRTDAGKVRKIGVVSLEGYAKEDWVTEQLGGYATKQSLEDGLKGKVDNAFLSRLLSVLDGNGDEVAVNDMEAAIDSIKVKFGLWTEHYLSAKGKNPDGGTSGGGGSSYSRLDSWGDYDAGKAGWVLSAGLGYDLYGRVLDLEAGAVELSVTGTGNGLAGFTQDGNSVVFERGEFLTGDDLAGYAKESWVEQQGYATEAWVTGKGYATVADLDGRIDDLVNGAPAAYDTLKEIADVLQGNVDSIDDILTALGGKADKATTLAGYGITDAWTKSEADGRYALKTVSISAGAGLTGGGTLAASRTLGLATVGTAGTYTKVVVDAYGRVTGHSALAAGDIPALGISKITGLQEELDSKLDAARFEELFEKVNIGTSSAPVWAIRAKYGLYTESFLSANGVNPDSGGTVVGVTALSELTDVSITPETLSNNDMLRWNGSKWVAVAMADITPDLSGYATQAWVTSQKYLTTVSIATITDLHSSWDSVLKSQKPAWLTTVSLATISDLHASWDALLKAA